MTVTGWRQGSLTQETFVRQVYASRVNGKLLSAIQLTTAAGICAMVDLHREGRLPQAGFVRQEQASLADFLANRFGRHYAGDGNQHSESLHHDAPARRAA